MTSSLLESLPQDVLQPILADWLDLTSFVRFDSALCCSGQRERHLATVAAPGFVLRSLHHMGSEDEEPFESYYFHALVSWLLVKEIKVSHLPFVPVEVKKKKISPLSTYTTYLREYGAHITSIDFSDTPPNNEMIFEWIAEYCPNLTHVTATDCYLGSNFELVLQSCQSIHELKLTVTWENYCEPTFENDGLLSLPNLRVLTTDFVGYSERFYNTLLKAAPNLEQLRIVNLTHASTLQNITSLTHLQTLSVEFCSALTDAALLQIAHGCPLIHTLNLRGCMELTNQGIRQMLPLLTLRSINLTGLSFDDNTLHALATTQSHTLQVAYIYSLDCKISVDGVSKLLQLCTNLHTLEAPITYIDWRQVQTLTTLTIAEGPLPPAQYLPSADTHFPNLQYLTVDSVCTESDKSLFSNDSVLQVQCNAPRLRKLKYEE